MLKSGCSCQLADHHEDRYSAHRLTTLRNEEFLTVVRWIQVLALNQPGPDRGGLAVVEVMNGMIAPLQALFDFYGDSTDSLSSKNLCEIAIDPTKINQEK